jgi:ATP-dependent Clp protease ATP-binding subunit ClpX
MKHEHITAESIHQKMLQHVAPLPSQAEYARNLASILSMHVHRNELIDDGLSPDELPAPSAIVVAPTGQGKTFLLRKMAESLELNVITIDCSTLSAEGWKGTSVSQRLAAAKEDAKNQRAFERSIVFFDEIDKLKFWGTHYDQGNAMVNILQLFNGGTVSVEVGKKIESLNVSRFTVLFGGAFSGLEDIIRERIYPKRKIGFDSNDAREPAATAELMQQVTSVDLAKFGLMPELLGRIGTILSIPPLELEDYRQLLNAEAGSLRQKYHNYFWNLYGVTFEIADTGVEAIAQKCMEDPSSGARAVNPIVNDIMRYAVTAVESQAAICKVILDADENGCCIRYEHGERIYAFRSQVDEKEEQPPVIIKAKNMPAMVRKLCRYYQNAGGELDTLPQLEAFLDCAITFLFTSCKPSEFTYESLEKLARSVHRTEGKSGFDVILADARQHVPVACRLTLDKLYSPWMQKNLVSALQLIAIYIETKNHVGKILLDIPRKKNAQ